MISWKLFEKIKCYGKNKGSNIEYNYTYHLWFDLERSKNVRRSVRDSIRKIVHKDTNGNNNITKSPQHIQEQRHTDELSIRDGNCSFLVKYLGCIEVTESRGIRMCEEAMDLLRKSGRSPIRGSIHITGDSIRFIDDSTKCLIIDQTIERLGFCTADRTNEYSFCYINRDGTTRRWMCHGFLTRKQQTGKRLAQAIGYAFKVYHEKVIRQEASINKLNCKSIIQMNKPNPLTVRSGNEMTMVTNTKTKPISTTGSAGLITSTISPKIVITSAIKRPHASPLLLERFKRQGSLRIANNSSPFKRQLSLRYNDLPSQHERRKNTFVQKLDFESIQPVPTTALRITETYEIFKPIELHGMLQVPSQPPPTPPPPPPPSPLLSSSSSMPISLPRLPKMLIPPMPQPRLPRLPSLPTQSTIPQQPATHLFPPIEPINRKPIFTSKTSVISPTNSINEFIVNPAGTGRLPTAFVQPFRSGSNNNFHEQISVTSTTETTTTTATMMMKTFDDEVMTETNFMSTELYIVEKKQSAELVNSFSNNNENNNAFEHGTLTIPSTKC